MGEHRRADVEGRAPSSRRRPGPNKKLLYMENSHNAASSNGRRSRHPVRCRASRLSLPTYTLSCRGAAERGCGPVAGVARKPPVGVLAPWLLDMHRGNRNGWTSDACSLEATLPAVPPDPLSVPVCHHCP